MDIRPRRLRKTPQLRNMVRETRLSPSSIIYPIFVREGNNIVENIPSLEGQFRYSVDTVCQCIEECLKNGITKCILFGIPDEKDCLGSQAYNKNGIVQKAIREIKSKYNEFYVVTDVCMCEYTDHGHCGILKDKYVDNDETVKYISKIALSHVESGADMVAPSDMMDGRVKAIRDTLDKNGFVDTPIMSYSAKYSSAFYGPFRDAAGSAPSFGDRKSYQMDFHNSKEAIKECCIDIDEGADIIMVKPAMSYLDIIKTVSESFNVPVAAYSVSGEYAMIKAAAKAGLIDEYNVLCESAVSIFRAGADILITYFAKEISQAIKRGDIG